MHTFDVQEILRRTLSGASRQVIARELGISKSTVQRYLDRIKQANLTLEQAIGLKSHDLEPVLVSEPRFGPVFMSRISKPFTADTMSEVRTDGP